MSVFSGTSFAISLATALDVPTGSGPKCDQNASGPIKPLAVETQDASPYGFNYGLALDRTFLTGCKAAIRLDVVDAVVDTARAYEAAATAYFTVQVPNGPRHHRNPRALGRIAYRAW